VQELGQRKAGDATKKYVDNLREALLQTDTARLSEVALNSYVEALESAWRQAQESYREAAVTSLKSLQDAWQSTAP
jgi:hypothetical protein